MNGRKARQLRQAVFGDLAYRGSGIEANFIEHHFRVHGNTRLQKAIRPAKWFTKALIEWNHKFFAKFGKEPTGRMVVNAFISRPKRREYRQMKALYKRGALKQDGDEFYLEPPVYSRVTTLARRDAKKRKYRAERNQRRREEA